MIKMKLVLFISIGINFIAMMFAFRRLYYANRNNDSAAIWAFRNNRQSIYDVLPIDSGSIVFIGDSQVQKFATHEFFNNLKIVNRGIEGETSYKLLQRLPSILKSKPSKIIIQTGVNDLLEDTTNTNISSNINSILKQTKELSPQTRVYVNNIFPTANNLVYLNDKILSLNNSLIEIVTRNNCTLIDVNKPFSITGKLNPKYDIGDGLHLSGAGYIKWTEILTPYLNK